MRGRRCRIGRERSWRNGGWAIGSGVILWLRAGIRLSRSRLLGQQRRLSGQTGAARRGLGGRSFFWLVVGLAALEGVQFALQALVAVFILADLLGDGGAVVGVELVHQLRDEMLVLQRLVHGGQTGAGCLALARLDLSVGGIGVGLVALVADLFLEDVQVEIAQGIWAEAAALEARVRGDVWVGLQQLGDGAEDLRVHTIGMERLEQEERLEVGVGGQAIIHPPGPLRLGLGLDLGWDAMGSGWERSHGDERGGECRAVDTQGRRMGMGSTDRVRRRDGGGGGRWKSRKVVAGRWLGCVCVCASGEQRRASKARPAQRIRRAGHVRLSPWLYLLLQSVHCEINMKPIYNSSDRSVRLCRRLGAGRGGAVRWLSCPPLSGVPVWLPVRDAAGARKPLPLSPHFWPCSRAVDRWTAQDRDAPAATSHALQRARC